MSQKLHIKKGDTVIVNAGDDKGTQGRVLEIIHDKKNRRVRAIVEGVNMVTKHTKPSAKNTNGGFVEKEAPVHISNLNLLDPKEKKATRVGRRQENGKWVRYAKKSGEVIK
ncbi:MAG: 50S ribosomal protein L24 [Bacteroidales bacterium]|jgi:large subunit ribosomal protein L24|nr:50S ribosomal protein L24 [Bacteroidales bacterium]